MTSKESILPERPATPVRSLSELKELQGSRIYLDFSEDIAWIRRQIASSVDSLPPSLLPLAEYYTKGRLKVVKDSWAFKVEDPRMGRPIPYLAFWVADALGLTDKRLRRLSGLSLVYSSIATTIRDDIMDTGPANYSGKAKLDSLWSLEYLHTLREVFPDQPGFRQVASAADAEWRKYKRWESNPSAGAHPWPFSADFLEESSRYYISCALPSLSAIAYAMGKTEDIPRIERYLREFSMGWKIFDDLMDWEKDLLVGQMNRSSVLIYFRNRMGHKKALDRIDALSWFLSDEFVREAYAAMVSFYQRARRAVTWYGDSYLDRFLQEQISFQSEKRDSLLRSASATRSNLNEGLASVLGSGRPRVGYRKRDSLPQPN